LAAAAASPAAGGGLEYWPVPTAVGGSATPFGFVPATPLAVTALAAPAPLRSHAVTLRPACATLAASVTLPESVTVTGAADASRVDVAQTSAQASAPNRMPMTRLRASRMPPSTE